MDDIHLGHGSSLVPALVNRVEGETVVRLAVVEVELTEMADGACGEVLGELEVIARLVVLEESEEILEPVELVKLAGLVSLGGGCGELCVMTEVGLGW
jgi:hypothetical protein